MIHRFVPYDIYINRSYFEAWPSAHFMTFFVIRLYAIFKVLSPILACGMMDCSSQSRFKELCDEFKVWEKQTNVYFSLRLCSTLTLCGCEMQDLPFWLIHLFTRLFLFSDQGFVEQGTREWFQFDQGKYMTPEELSADMKDLWYTKADCAKGIARKFE